MCRHTLAKAVKPCLFLILLTGSTVWPIGHLWAFDITVDGDGNEWNPDGVVMDAPGFVNVGHIARNGTNQGQFIWTDEVGDHRTDFPALNDRVDLTEFRVASNSTTLCMMATFTDIDQATGDGAPVLQVGVDTDRVSASGEESFSGLPDTRVSTSAYWEFLISTRFGTGADANAAPSVTPDPEVVGWTFPQVGSAAISETNDLIELCVAWSDLGFGGPPANPLRLTVGVFGQNAAGDVWDVSGQSDLLDAITNYGVPGTETGAPGVAGTNTYAEVTPTDDQLDYYFDLYFDSETGEVRAPLLISEVAMRSGDADFIELYNPSPFAIDLLGYVVGDDQDPATGTEGMVVLPTFSLAQDEFVVFASDGAAFLAQFGSEADFNMTTVSYYEASWGGTALALDDTADEVLLLDPSETVVDVAIWGGAETTWLGHQDTNVTVPDTVSLQRTDLTEDTHQIDGALGGDFFTASPTPGETVECTEDDQCLDGNYCNGAETCDESFVCVSGTPPADATPDDGIPCTDTTCTNGDNPNEGTVTHEPNDANCDDSQFCNGAETCDPDDESADGNGCVAGTAPTLTDGVDCTDDSCDETDDEVDHTPNHSLCDDDSYCNGLEQCDAVLDCVDGTPPAEGVDDGHFCTVTTCTDGDNPNEGTITHVPSDALCLDGRFCNGTESCVPDDGHANANGCIVSDLPDLDDGFACTLDSCSEGADITDNVGMVSHGRRDWWCLDDLFCNGDEDCNPANAAADADGCVAGSPPVTNDLVDCTVDACDEATDSITHNADDTLCVDDDDCTHDFCDVSEDCRFSLLGCTIDEACVFQGASNPSNACHVCNIAVSDSAWTQLSAAATCANPTCNDDGNAVGTATCSNEGLCVAPEPEICGDGGCRDGDCLDLCGVDDDCADGFWCQLETGECTDDNRPPLADAGVAQVVDEFGLVTLDGRGSVDPDGDPVTYAWSQTEGLEVDLSQPTASTTTFDAPRVQEGSMDLVFELVVSDDESDSEPAETTVTVENATGNTAPVASIEGESEVISGGALILDGSGSSDPDTDVITFLWSQESGPQAVLGTTNQSTLAVGIPDLEEPAELSFGLIVNDGLLNSELTTFQVSVTLDTGQADTTDMGTDAESDAPTSADVATATEPDDEGCGCFAVGTSTVPPLALFLSIGLGLAVVRLRRTR